jgi:bifunctional UDP-N-acetylglucosamine pyrophosphorylase / glucosamine-1-phosphate N-acetyltransferase
MAPESRGCEKAARLIEKGAFIPNPAGIDVGDEVDLDRVAGQIDIYPGCRIYGAQTVISAGARLGAEAPVTLDDCRLGPDVELKGGYFRQSVFLEGAAMGSGAQVREACLLEEGANGAHCVGLKQTILLPFVTLGSLINFCDCLMAGGTSRKQHSEVGSSYIHFNYTPDGDKTTPSLFGDVPRGVMLDQPPIFLGGQGGAVGPLRVGFGTVATAGSVLRHDVLDDGKLVAEVPRASFVRDHQTRMYQGLRRTVRNNVIYLANLAALEEWYRRVRRPFFARQELGILVFEGALETLAAAKQERLSRLLAMAEKVPATDEVSRQWRDRAGELRGVFGAAPKPSVDGDAFVAALGEAGAEGYVASIQSLSEDMTALGVHWLQQIVESLLAEARAALPSLEL